jgi:hypothetical protein
MLTLGLASLDSQVGLSSEAMTQCARTQSCERVKISSYSRLYATPRSFQRRVFIYAWGVSINGLMTQPIYKIGQRFCIPATPGVDVVRTYVVITWRAWNGKDESMDISLVNMWVSIISEMMLDVSSMQKPLWYRRRRTECLRSYIVYCTVHVVNS